MDEPRWRSFERIEPDPRDPDPVPGASVPLGDPLWLLARQWWMGEMDFHDGGSPIDARVTIAEAVIDGVEGARVDPAEVVPSAILAAEHDAHWRDRFRLALSLVADAEAHGLESRMAGALLAFAPMEASDTLLARVAAERRIDGVAVLEAIRDGTINLPADLAEIATRWAARQVAGRGAFDPDRRTHSVRMSGPDGLSFRADSAPGPDLRWSDLEGSMASTVPVRTERRALARASLPGQQPPRWWRIENEALDFAAAPAGPSDLGQLLIAAAYAEQGQVQWRCEIDVPVNALVEVRSAELRDTFGRVHSASDGRASDLRGWCYPNGALPILARAPLLEGPVLEEAVLRTDPIDNLAWLEETVLRDRTGRGTLWRPRPETLEASEPTVALRRAPPENWTPYEFVDGTIQSRPLSLNGGRAEGRGRFFHDSYALVPTEIGSYGIRYEHRFMLARAPSGARVVWRIDTARSAARPGSSSGLLHDLVVQPEL